MSNPNYEPDWLGRIYGAQWRDYIGVNKKGKTVHLDQLAELIQALKKDPHSRRMGVTAWNPVEFEQMCLPPCHSWFQCHVTSEGQLNLIVYLRSLDLFLGAPFDIASYAALMLIICNLTKYKAGTLTMMVGSAHIYESHYAAVDELLQRDPFDLPKVAVRIPKGEKRELDTFEPTDFEFITPYQYHPAIKAPMIV